MLIITGKNTITATTAIHETGLLGPNQLNRIGEKAMIGTELAAMANGIIAWRNITQRAVTSAMRMQPALPRAKPPNALRSVLNALSNRIDCWSANASRMLVGLGIRNCLMSNTRTISSQASSTATATTSVGR